MFEFYENHLYVSCSSLKRKSIKPVKKFSPIQAVVFEMLFYTNQLGGLPELLDHSTLVERFPGSKPHSDLSQAVRRGFVSSL